MQTPQVELVHFPKARAEHAQRSDRDKGKHTNVYTGGRLTDTGGTDQGSDSSGEKRQEVVSGRDDKIQTRDSTRNIRNDTQSESMTHGGLHRPHRHFAMISAGPVEAPTPLWTRSF